MEIRFLNVDLEIESTENLQPLIDDLGEEVSVLYHGENGNGYDFASFELIPLTFSERVDAVIAALCLLIENLSAESKRLWDNSCSKKLNQTTGDWHR